MLEIFQSEKIEKKCKRQSLKGLKNNSMSQRTLKYLIIKQDLCLNFIEKNHSQEFLYSQIFALRKNNMKNEKIIL